MQRDAVLAFFVPCSRRMSPLDANQLSIIATDLPLRDTFWAVSGLSMDAIHTALATVRRTVGVSGSSVCITDARRQRQSTEA